MSKDFIRREVTVPRRLAALFAVLCLLCFCITAAVKNAQARRLEREAAEIQREVLEAQAQAKELERRLAFTATDEYVAQEARRRFGYMEEGEIRFVVEGAEAGYEDAGGYI